MSICIIFCHVLRRGHHGNQCAHNRVCRLFVVLQVQGGQNESDALLEVISRKNETIASLQAQVNRCEHKQLHGSCHMLRLPGSIINKRLC